MDLLQGAESHARSVLKAISWRTLGTIDTFAISWFLTGRLTVAGSIARLEFATKVAWYYLHERILGMIEVGPPLLLRRKRDGTKVKHLLQRGRHVDVAQLCELSQGL